MTESILKKIIALRQQIQAHNHAYYTLDEPSITDAEYDRLIRSLRALEKQHPEYASPDSPTQSVGGPVLAAFSKIEHEMAMLSLDNVFSADELNEFIQRIQNRLKSV